jgi:hypothetical protein
MEEFEIFRGIEDEESKSSSLSSREVDVNIDNDDS